MSAYTRQGRPQEDLLSSCVSGMGQMSVKWLEEQSRMRALKTLEPVFIQSSPPPPEPLTVSFDYTGIGLTHKMVYESAVNALKHIQGAAVLSLQFIPRSIILGGLWIENRWLLRVNSENAVKALLYTPISIFSKQVKCRRYSDVQDEEYLRYLEKRQKEEQKQEHKAQEHKAQKHKQEEPQTPTLPIFPTLT